MNQPIRNKPIYTLRHVVNETGINADTLRAWERRYDLPHPSRTAGDQRLFSDHDIQTIKWLISQKNAGLSISKAVNLWKEIEQNGHDPLSYFSTPKTEPLVQTDQVEDSRIIADTKKRWILACLNFDEQSAERELLRSFARFSMETVCSHILQSGLAEIGTLWHQGKASVQQEHFATQLALRKLHGLIASAPQPIRNQTILITCPEGEAHTISSLLITLLLRNRGWNVVDLGANVPIRQIEETIRTIKPDLVVMTAMRLATAAALRETALLLNTLNVATAFGGWIFNEVPGLGQKFPGYFLGMNLFQSISTIENLLTIPHTQFPFLKEDNKFSEAIRSFNMKESGIHTEILRELQLKTTSDTPIEYLQEANDLFSQDILAALALGDLSLVNINLKWVKSLLTQRGISELLFMDYLAAFQGAVQSQLGDTGLPITDWLTVKIYENKRGIV